MFKVDYTDGSYPAIVACQHGSSDAVTFRKAKKELVEHLKYLYRHWKERYRLARALKESDVTAFEEG
jgi:hypothetical protein